MVADARWIFYLKQCISVIVIVICLGSVWRQQPGRANWCATRITLTAIRARTFHATAIPRQEFLHRINHPRGDMFRPRVVRQTIAVRTGVDPDLAHALLAYPIYHRAELCLCPFKIVMWGCLPAKGDSKHSVYVRSAAAWSTPAAVPVMMG